ncbi:MAG TPA: hypothetical protein VH855_15430 [Acetobacteraceae bacterium]
MAIAEPAEEHAAQGAHDERAPEDQQRGEQGGFRRLVGKEQRADRDRQHGVKLEIVVLDHRAKSGGDRAAPW